LGRPRLSAILRRCPAPALPAEDAFGLGDVKARPDAAVTIVVPMLARIANFDEFDPLRIEPQARLVFVRAGEPLPVADLIVLPGSKATIADLVSFASTLGVRSEIAYEATIEQTLDEFAERCEAHLDRRHLQARVMSAAPASAAPSTMQARR
jgi:cobyric acid synthase